jgi:SAM-dependent methyltransferase
VTQGRHDSAWWLRVLIDRTPRDPLQFRATLASVPPGARDACVDGVLGLDGLPADGPALPSGCVPYLPCPVDTLLRVVEHAPVCAADVFVDVGSGLGRAAALVHLLTGARAVGLEVQPPFVAAARALATRLRLPDLSFVECDAAELAPALADGLAAPARSAGSRLPEKTTVADRACGAERLVFFLYCPFSGDRLEKFLACLEPIARARTIHICAVDLPLPPRDWLTLASTPSPELAIYRSQLRLP